MNCTITYLYACLRMCMCVCMNISTYATKFFNCEKNFSTLILKYNCNTRKAIIRGLLYERKSDAYLSIINRVPVV